MVKVQISKLLNNRKDGVFFLILSLIFFRIYSGPNPGLNTTFGIKLQKEWSIIDSFKVDSIGFAKNLTILAIAASIILLLPIIKQKMLRKTIDYLLSVITLLAFISWAAKGQFIPLTGLLQGSLLLAVPLIFGSMAGVISERSGVINIAIEGQLLAGAFVAGVVASLTKHPLYGLALAPAAGALIGVLLAVFAVKYQIDQVVLGFVINVLVIGLTNFLYKKLLIPYQDTWNVGGTLKNIKIPILGDLPIVGPILFDQNIIVYLMYIGIFWLNYALFKTRWGLRTIAVGEHPAAADTVGIDVNKIRFKNVILAGAVAGLGGAFFTVGAVGAFGKEMTAGKGFIALAALIFGKWSPIGALFACLLFGFADNLQGVLSIVGTSIPSSFMLMVPYVATIIAVTGFVGRVRAPAADGVPYRRGGS
jgi:simple sugar transport system permease protein